MSYATEREYFKKGYQRGYAGKPPGKLFEWPNEKEKAARDRGYAEGQHDRRLDEEKKARLEAARKGA